MIVTEGNKNTRSKTCPSTIFHLQILCGLAWNQINPERVHIFKRSGYLTNNLFPLERPVGECCTDDNGRLLWGPKGTLK